MLFKNNKVVNWAVYLFYSFFFFLLVKISLQYIPIDFDVAFLRIKQDEMQFLHYRIAFFVHVFTAIFTLLAGFTQFSSSLREQYPLLHSRIGWLYIVAILVFAAPSGLVLGYYANGGFWSQVSFGLLGVFWFWFTYQAWQSLRIQDYSKHRNYMIRSFALTFSAITLRLWKYIIVFLVAPRPMTVYRIVAWLGWVLNLLLAEYFIYKYFSKKIENSKD